MLIAAKFGVGVGALQTVIILSDVRQSYVVCTQECDRIGVDLNAVLNFEPFSASKTYNLGLCRSAYGILMTSIM